MLDLVKRTLPVISAAAQSAVEEAGESSVYSDTKLLHYATVETEHPYKQATVTHFKVWPTVCILRFYCWQVYFK